MAFFRVFLVSALLALSGAVAMAQVTFGGLNQDSSAPVEISADQLSVDQDNNSAVFTGNVVIGQGALRLAAPKVQVTYLSNGGIGRLLATGGVTLVTATEEAEANQADYSLTDNMIVMSGDVLLKQGNNALSAQTMRVNLSDGTAQLDGRVRTIIQPSGN